MQAYSHHFVDQDPERLEHIFDSLADDSGSIDYLSWSKGIRLQVGSSFASGSACHKQYLCLTLRNWHTLVCKQAVQIPAIVAHLQ